MIYFETKSKSPYYNLAFEEYVLKNKSEGDILILWQNDNTIVVGSNQNTAEEINAEYVAKHGINVARRTTGGGAVYQDLGNLNYSFITTVVDRSKLSMEQFTTPVVEALSSLGVKAYAAGRNDILIDEKKISGTAQRLHGSRVLHHGTLLFNSRLETVANALNVDPTKFQSKSTKSVRSRVGNIIDFLPKKMALNEFWDYLKVAFAKDGFVEGELTEQDFAEIDKLAERNASFEWNYGKSPKCDMHRKERFAGGGIELRLSISDGNIKEIAFFGDFLALRPITDIMSALINSPYNYDEVDKVLDGLPLSEYFGTITKKEVLSLFFSTIEN